MEPWRTFLAANGPIKGPLIASCLASGTTENHAWTPSTTDANCDCEFVESTLVSVAQKNWEEGRAPLGHPFTYPWSVYLLTQQQYRHERILSKVITFYSYLYGVSYCIFLGRLSVDSHNLTRLNDVKRRGFLLKRMHCSEILNKPSAALLVWRSLKQLPKLLCGLKITSWLLFSWAVGQVTF